MKWVSGVISTLKKVKEVIRFVLAIEAAIDAFNKVLEKDEPVKVIENEEKEE
ncbi:hypothetical protein [Labilibacter marinus]|uniref:hypothetical protein n=1 Tax=Labilibacter marinus TaxID=1477105 RepID=UPI001300DAB0|nr:hypothetical protein [Labilibacter marinus]